MMTVAELTPRLLALPERDREELAYVLLDSLPEDDDISEALRREAEMEADPRMSITHEEFMSYFPEQKTA